MGSATSLFLLVNTEQTVKKYDYFLLAGRVFICYNMRAYKRSIIMKSDNVVEEKRVAEFNPEEEQFVKVTLQGTGADGTDAIADKVNIQVQNMTQLQLLLVTIKLLEKCVKDFDKNDDSIYGFLGRIFYEGHTVKKMLQSVLEQAKEESEKKPEEK